MLVADLLDSLGPVGIPTPPVIAAFPLRPDFGIGIDYNPAVVVHTFDQPGLKAEQRFLLAPMSARRFKFAKQHLSCAEYDDLKTHFELAQGGYAQFPLTVYKPGPGHGVPNPSQPSFVTETVTARYENPNITFDYMVALLMNGPGLSFLEVPSTVPAYTSLGARLVRFPDAGLTAALQDQFQQIIPLITVTPRNNPTAAFYISNQRCTVDAVTFLPRLLEWSGISQSLGENSDSASFTFGNADGVWQTYVNQINLYAASLQFSLYHVGTQKILDLWKGSVLNWGFDTGGRFQVNAADGVYPLGLAYPSRKILRTCWKQYKGRWCPSTSSLPDCPKDYDSCVARGVPHSFGGFVVPLQKVRIKDNSTGVFGFGRSMMTSVSVTDDTVYQRPLQEVYTDQPMNVTCDVAAGRDEDSFYAALGIVGEGPISSYNGDLILHHLDGQPPHDPLHDGGFRGVIGTDPSGTNDFVAISIAQIELLSSGLIKIRYDLPPPDSTYTGGIAFAEIRRTDAKGLQLSAVSDRAMQVNVIGGIGGWVWNGVGNRTWLPALHNAVWVAVNVYLRGLGLRADDTNAGAIPASVMEQYVDVDQANQMAAICDTMVPKMIGTGSELQFPFRGVLKEAKPLRDWLREILNCCLGYFTFVNGKLWIGIRVNSSVLTGNAFRRESILFKSLVAAPLQPQFNWLTGNFGDEEFGGQLNNVTLYDIDHASFLGTADSPQYLTNTMSFVGVSNKSQCARIITTRVREEIGGLKSGKGPHGTGSGIDEQMNARNFQFRTTVLALGTQVGDIVSVTHDTMPNAGYVEGRVNKWTLNPDFSMDLQCTSTVDDMYDLVAGPKPVDVAAAPPIPETLQSATGLAWMPNAVAPFAGDPLYPDPAERTFDLWQDYSITRDGKWEPALYVAGEGCINDFVVPSAQPRIFNPKLVAGGALAGPQVVYAGVTQHGVATARGAVPKTGIALVAHAKGTATGGGTATTTPVDTTGANLLVCAVSSYGSSGGLTDSFSNAWTALTPSGSGGETVQFFYCVPPSGKVGAGHTFSTPGSYPVVSMEAFSGVDATTPFNPGSAHGATGSFPLQTGSVATAVGDLVVSAISTTGGSGCTVDSSLSITDSYDTVPSNTVGAAIAYRIAASAGSINPTWSGTGSPAGSVAVASFKAAAGGVTPPPDSGGEVYTVPSNLVAVYVPQGVTGKALQLTMTPADGTWTDWDLYVGTDRRRIAWQSSATAALPSTYTFNGPIHPMTRSLPEAAARRVRIAAKLVHHSGVAGVSVTGIVGTTQIQCNDFKGSTDNWVNRIVSALADFSDGSAPLWNFKVTGFDSASGTLTVTPGFATDPVQVGDVLIMRSTATAAGMDYVEDSLWVNFPTNHQFGNNGLIPAGGGPDEEKGRLYRILRGTGAGQVRQIVGNTAIRINVHPDWDIIPDATSIGIVEAPEYLSTSETSDFDVPAPGVRFEQRMRVENLADKVALVTGYLVDSDGQITDEEFAVHREIYIYGEPPGVRDIGPAANDPGTGQPWLIDETDQTIRADTSANDVSARLLPLAAYHGRTLAATNNNGPHNLVVTPISGETLFDGQSSVTVAPLETVRFTAG